MPGIIPVLTYITILFSNILYSKQKLEEYTLNFNKDIWSFDQTNGVYYQIGVVYCTNPVDTSYQSFGIYVPKEYLSCTERSGNYSCQINSSGTKGSYTASSAPIILPVDTWGYAAMKAPTTYEYNKVSKFIEKGIIYLYAGCRGRYEDSSTVVSGAPWPITDLKSAIRYVRYNTKLIPGNKENIYTFGMSGGGAQSCLMGVTGNSVLFTKYLTSNGAAIKDSDGNEIKDNVKGSQCWCPITNLDTADAAYEWNMGQYFTTGTRGSENFTKLLSEDLADEYVKYVNDIKLKDPQGKELTLTNRNEGSYYNFLKSVIEESLNNFFQDTTFPYTPDERPGPPPHLKNLAKTYNTIQEYIQEKNSDGEWLYYDESTKKASINSVGDFVKHCKSASKDVGAFDDLNKNQAENKIFGTSINDKVKHFDLIMANLLNNNKERYAAKSDWKESYITDYLNDITSLDSQNINVTSRVDMYNPMYYLINYYDGYNKSDVADYFRINTGLFQSDTGNVVEMNLYLALKNYGKNVKFTTVWEKQHVEAERTGDSTDNFISWIQEIEGGKDNPSGKNNFICISYLVYLLSLIILF